MAITYDTHIPEEEQDGLLEEIDMCLRQLGIPGTIKGHRYLTVAIGQVAVDPQRLDFITKELYPDIAKMFDSSRWRVERAIRTAIKRCWERGGRKELEKLAGFHLQRKPTNSEFIDLVASYFRR